MRKRWRVLVFVAIMLVLIGPLAVLRLTGQVFARRNIYLYMQVPARVPMRGSQEVLTRPYLPTRSTLQVTLRNDSGKRISMVQERPEMDYYLIVTDLAGRAVEWEDPRRRVQFHIRQATYRLPPGGTLVELYDLKRARCQLNPGDYLMKMRHEVLFEAPRGSAWVESPPIRVQVGPDMELTQIR